MKWTAALLFATLAFAQPEAAKRWWSHVEFLASDALEGRAPGTPGHTKAAQYVSKQFDSLGLKTSYQMIPFQQRQLDESKSSLALVHSGTSEPLVFGRDATMAVRGESGRSIEAGLVFVGYGLRIPEANHDDLAGLDLKGKVAVIVRGAPKAIPGALAAHAQSTAEQWRNLHAAGAIGVISIQNPKRADIPWERMATMRGRPTVTLADPKLVDTATQQLSVTLNPAAADRLFSGTPLKAADLFDAMDSDKPLPRMELTTRIRARAAFTTASLQAENVLGILTGSDPKLRNEYIVFSAHLDHVGKGAPMQGDGIYNGAMDNAAGIATLIEVAREIHAKKLKRSVVFAAVTGEESGLLGSKYLAAYPAPGIGRVVANLNTDMFLPIIPLKGITVYGLDESDLGPEFADAAKQLGIAAHPDPEPHRNSFIRSDQYSFIKRGIPALAFKFHAAPGTPEGTTMKRWLSERYHGPSDDLQQPVEREDAAKFNSIMAAFVERVANRAATPSWNANSFFRRYSTQSN